MGTTQKKYFKFKTIAKCYVIIIVLFIIFGCSNRELKKINPNLEWDKTLKDIAPSYYKANTFLPAEDNFQVSQDEFRIINAGPKGLFREFPNSQYVFVVFSHGVVKKSLIGKKKKKSSIMTIQPFVKGQYRWVSPNCLLFEPREGFFKNGEYEITISGKTKSIYKKSLDSDFQFRFISRLFEIKDFWSGPLDSIQDSSLRQREDIARNNLAYTYIETIYPMSIKRIKELLEIRQGLSSLKYKVRLVSDNFERAGRAIYEFRIKSKIKEGAALQLFWEDIPLDGRKIEIEPKFSLKRVYYGEDYHRLFLFPDRPNIEFLNIEFTSVPDLKSLENRIFINNRVVKKNSIILRKTRILYLGDLLDKDENILMLKEGIVDLNGRRLASCEPFHLPKRKLKNYLFSPYFSFNYIPLSRSYLEVETLGLQKGQWVIQPIENLNGKNFRKSFSIPFQMEKSSYPKNIKRSIKEIQKKLGKEKLFKAYVDSFQNENQQQVNIFQITPFALTSFISKKSVNTIVTSLENGKPIANAVVFLYCKGKKFRAKSNSDGIVTFYKKNICKDFRNESLILKAQGSEGVVLAEIGASKKQLNDSSQLIQFAYLASEKTSYVEGESVNLSIVDLFPDRGSFKPTVGTFSVRLKQVSPFSKNYSRSYGRLNSTGLTYFSYQLPEKLPTGQYQLLYKGQKSYGEIKIEIRGNSNYCSLKTNFQNYISGDKIQLKIKTNLGDQYSRENEEVDFVFNQNFVPIASSKLPWNTCYFGPEIKEKVGAQIKRGYYFEHLQASHYSFDSSNFYSDLPCYPSQVEIIPRVISRNKIIGGKSRTVDLFPSEFMIAARYVKHSKPVFNKGKKIGLEYRLFNPSGNPLVEVPRGEILAELFSLDRFGSPLSVVSEISKLKLSEQGVLKFRVKQSGRYRLSLKSEDSRGNRVNTEVPLYIVGSNSASDYVQMVPIKRSFSIERGAEVWVNLPKNLKMDRGQKIFLVKEQNGVRGISSIPSFSGSQLIKVPLTKEDYPQVRVHLVAWDSMRKDIDISNERYLYNTILTSCSLVVNAPIEYEPEFVVSGLQNGLPGAVHSIGVRVAKNFQKNQKGRIVAAFVKNDFLEKNKNLKMDLFFLNNQFLSKSIFVDDTHKNIVSGKICSSEELNSLQRKEQLWLKKKECSFTEPFNIQAGEESTFYLNYPKEVGNYQLLLTGVWNSVPFSRLYPVEVLDSPVAKLKMPFSLMERDISTGIVSIPKFNFLEDDESILVSLSISLIEELSENNALFHRNKIEKLSSIYPNEIELSEKNKWKQPFSIIANKPGKYKIKMSMKYREKVEVKEQELRIYPNDTVVHFRNRVTNNFGKVNPSLPIKLPLAKPIQSALEFSIGTAEDTALHQLVKALISFHQEDLTDVKVSTLFPWVLSRGAISNFGLNYDMSSRTFLEELEKIKWLQNLNGGYPLCWNKKNMVDYYTTVRVADLFKSSEVNYYDYLNKWRLTQYLKLAFKGEHAVNYSNYLLAYSAWVLARYDENIINSARNLLEKKNLSIAEMALASMALLITAEKERISVDQYIDRPLQFILHYFDPDLLNKEEPPNPIDAALTFLLLEQLGEHDREKEEALRVLINSDLSSLNSLDSTFAIRAIMVAKQKRYLNFSKNLRGLHFKTHFKIGQNEIFYLDSIGKNFSSVVVSPFDLVNPTRKNQYSILFDREFSDNLIADIHYTLKVPRETVSPISNCFHLEEQWTDSKGKVVDPFHLHVGQFYTYRLVFSSSGKKGPLHLHLPFGLTDSLSVKSIQTLNENSLVSEYFYYKNEIANEVKTEFTDKGLVVFYSSFQYGFDEIIVKLKAQYVGIYPLSPTLLHSYYDPMLEARSSGKLVRILY